MLIKAQLDRLEKQCLKRQQRCSRVNSLLSKINNFKRHKIKNLILGPEFTPKSNTALIKKNTAGLDVTLQEINKIKSTIKEEAILSYHQFFEGFASTLNISSSDHPRWDLILGRENHKKYINYLKDNLIKAENLITSYHTEIFEKRCSAYNHLSSVKLDDKELDIPVYNHTSLTGRTGIVSGTNFMTMKKSVRKKLKAVNEDNYLVEIDVKSCEPSLYLKYLGLLDNDTADVYEFIKQKLKLADIPREKFKRGILSILYGANERTSKNILKCTHRDISKIRSFFMIDELTAVLEAQYEKYGYIYNYYGRPINSIANPVNYWIQSSAVDYCSLGFSKMIKDNCLEPNFFVHDSVTVTVDKNRLEETLAITHIEDPVSGIKVNVETTLLT